MKIQIQLGERTLSASLLDNETAHAIYGALPFDLPYQTWGEEIYFGVPVHVNPPDGQELVEVGDLAFWPPGHAFCIFYGRTPASTDARPRAASEVRVFGKIEGDARTLKKAQAKRIQISALPEEPADEKLEERHPE